MKETFYFSHDYNARNDDKILEIRAKYKSTGYAIYFYCLEVMAERGDGYIIPSLLGGLSLGFGVDKDWLLEFLEFCVQIKIFEKNDTGFFSSRIIEHLKFRANLSQAGSRGAEKKWGSYRGALAPLIASKVKESKVNIIRGRFIIPKIEQVKEYCTQRKNSVSPEQFINFYEAKGWMIGKNKMKNWKAAIRTWENNNKQNDGIKVLSDGTKAIKKFGVWVNANDTNIKIDTNFYKELR